MIRGRAKANAFGSASGRELLDDRAARIAQAEELGDLVEGFAGRVVPRPAEEPAGKLLFEKIKRRVAARDEKGEGGKRDVPVLQEGGFDMALEMVDADERFP